MVSTDLHTVLAQNPLAVAMLGDPSAHHGRARNFIYRWFTDPASRRIYPEKDRPAVTLVRRRPARGRRTTRSRRRRGDRAGPTVGRTGPS
ncbi:MmyB family transcriptional regulator [Nocardia sp. NPDC003979]